MDSIHSIKPPSFRGAGRPRSSMPALAFLAALVLWLSPLSGAAAQSATAQGASSAAAPGAAAAGPETGAANSAADAKKAGPFVIRSVDFHIEGRTKDFVLMALIDPYQRMLGSSFPDRASLDAFVADKVRILSSQRVLASVKPRYETVPASGGGYDVALRFDVVDSWNVIALPYGKYDSNSGLLLSLRGRDYDFLGSAQPLELNLNYQRSPAGVDSYGTQLSLIAPFQAFGAIWDLGFAESGQFWTDGSASSITSASLAYNVPRLGFPLSVTAGQSFAYDAMAPAADPDLWYLGESLAATAAIPLTESLGSWRGVDLGPLTYIPSLELDYAWRPGSSLRYYGDGTAPSSYDSTIAQSLQNSPQFYGRGGTLTIASSALALGRIDWVGNMREGLSLNLSGRAAYNAQWDDLIGDLSFTGYAFAQWNGRAGIAARVLGMDRFSGRFSGTQNDSMTMLGQYLRGIIDARISGVQAAILNLELPVKLFDFPSHLVLRTHALDFEMQAQPFLDLALVRPDYSANPSKDWLWYSGGLELLFFPQGLRSFIVRVSAGWDLKNVAATRSLSAETPDGYSPYEIFLGLSLLF
ncbi:MAG TPA: hypothetical protein VMV90_15875 [Rectinemataceae bacterium]|nr:hypothetical protein [Rectinemataceae bacterium]